MRKYNLIGCSFGDIRIRAGSIDMGISFEVDSQDNVSLLNIMEDCGREETTFTLTVTDEAPEELQHDG